MPWQIICGDSEVLAIHAALLPIGSRGQVVLFGGDEHNQAQAGNDTALADPADVDNTRIHDLDSAPGSVTTIGSPTTDVFCSSHAFSGDGRLLIGGGTESWEGGEGPGGGHVHGGGQFGGHPACWIFNFRQRTWTRVADFIFKSGTDEGEGEGGGRWYPTLVTLPDGGIIAFSGHPSRRSRQWHNNNIPEIYSPAANAWRRLDPHNQMTFYPRLHVVPGNRVFLVSGTSSDSRFLDLATEQLTPEIISRPGGTNGLYDGWDCASVLLPFLPGDGYRARVLMCNDTDSHRIELDSTPSWTATPARSLGLRKFACATLLPTGRVVLTGGVGSGNLDSTGVRRAEIYDPGIQWNAAAPHGAYSGPDAWATSDEAVVVRNYHSTALLLPDGSVWTAGSSNNADSGDPQTVGERRIELFEPDYFSNPARPEITAAPASLDFASNTFRVRSPQRSSIQRVALMRCGSCTHAGDFDQRYVGLSFIPTSGTTDEMTVTYPQDASILPPGYYMLWIVDNAGLPCRNARFVRVAHRGALLLLDHSTFSSLEVEAVLSAGTPAVFPNAFYFVLDGFLPAEFSGTPAFEFAYDSAGGPSVPEFTLQPNGGPQFEHTPPSDEIPQRITFAFDAVFSGLNAFSAANLPGSDRSVFLRISLGAHSATGVLKFTRNPNPYMTDGPVEWLSTDVRVFRIKLGESRSGIMQGGNPNQFIRDLLTHFNGQPNNGAHPFNAISTDPETSSLDFAGVEGFPPLPVFNYAVAMVRYRALSTPATDVKVFFRMFQAATADVSFNETTTYRRHNNGPSAVPLLGKAGPVLISIPFFADERVDTSSASMTTQTDDTNRHTLAPAGADESAGYFGCWLDINQTTPRFPLISPGDGPFPAATFPFDPNGRSSIQQLLRGAHQCLVAEIHFTLDPVQPGATPGTSDNLSQRNLVIEHSDNPGSPDSHIVRHPFEIRPSAGNSAIFTSAAVHTGNPAGLRYRRRPDELMIQWGNLPAESSISIYLPDIAADDILALQDATRVSPGRLEREDANTVRCRGAANITWLPIPATGRAENLTGLLSVELPSTVVKGQTFRLTVHQVSGNRIIGSFEFIIPVTIADHMTLRLERQLSVLRHIQLTLPHSDRWYAVFQRYVRHFADKLRAIGGNPDAVRPSSSGTGEDAPDPCQGTPPGGSVRDLLCRRLGGALVLLIALAGCTLAFLPAGWAVAALLILLAGAVMVARHVASTCKPGRCAWLCLLLTGTLAASGVLALVWLLPGTPAPAWPRAVAALAIVNLVLILLAWRARCCPGGGRG